MNTEEILAARGKIYGDFRTHAEITQQLKDYIKANGNWVKLDSNKREALEMIMHKIGRILNGDPEYRDSWDDIAGYAKLAADLCQPK